MSEEPTTHRDTSTAAESGSVHLIVSAERTRMVLSGEIDVALTDELSEAIDDAERAGLPVEVDARHVSFMDSSGISMLARLARRVPGRLAVIEPPEVVRFLLEVTKIADVVDIVEADPGFPTSTPTATD